ncbi:MAG: homoserine dehydrogenase [Chloroflexales bacterium]|nr:homoserine dehydrogenase [Chloroflexales bacterium]
MQTYRFIIIGLGNIGRNFLETVLSRADLLRQRYGIALQLVGASDSAGSAYHPQGLDMARIIALKRARRSVAELPQGRPGGSSIELAQQAKAEFLIEASPTNLKDGQPGLDIVRTALRRGMHAVLASKGPLVLAYQELAALSDLGSESRQAPCLRFSGAVGGALPTINIGWRDLSGARISRVEMVVNGTTQVILQLMAQGQSFDAALAEAQQMGIVEPDPSLDVEGWDAANKLVILANAVLRQATTLSDLSVTGIRGVSQKQLQAAWTAGGRVSLVGLAEAQPDGAYRLNVAPTTLAADHPLARLGLGEMGIVYQSDIAGRTVATSLEDGPIGTTAAMLRDLIEIVMRR